MSKDFSVINNGKPKKALAFSLKQSLFAGKRLKLLEKLPGSNFR